MRTVYSVAVGVAYPFNKKSRKSIEFISKTEGIVGACPMKEATLLFYDTLNQAKIARNKMNGEGIQTGKNIMLCETDEQLEFINVLGVADI